MNQSSSFLTYLAKFGGLVLASLMYLRVSLAGITDILNYIYMHIFLYQSQLLAQQQQHLSTTQVIDNKQSKQIPSLSYLLRSILQLMKIQIILASILVFFSYFKEVSPLKEKEDQLNSALKELQLRIDNLTRKDQDFRLRFSRLFETNLANEGHNTSIDDISIVPSISIPYKDNLYYTMMTRKRNDYFTLRGDLIYSGIENSTLVATARNDHTFFVEMLDNRTLVFKKLNVYKKQSQLDIEITLDFSRFQDIRVDSVYAVNPSNRGHFVTADHQKGLIFCFDRQGSLLNQIKTEGIIVQIEKINNFLVVLTSKEFFYLNINRNYTKINCVWPEDSLESFTFEDTSFRSVFAKKNNSIILYDLGSYCRPMKSYPVPEKSNVFVTSQLLFIESKGNYFAINFTEGRLKSFNLPVNKCEGPQKFVLTRKLMSQYIISRICLRDAGINIAHILVDMDSNSPQIADFSKFRIPLLLFSFGVIIYVTVKNKKKENQNGENGNSFKEVLMGKMEIKEETSTRPDGSLSFKKESKIECHKAQVSGSNISVSSLKIKSK